ncbi:uncharacterized protein M6B38_396885 [Iris pallida]|uniref:Uncharacterized protein n=1 Tax=Iris pallida TaxID=29817 RepID=A0AAX6FVJ7_IRIPA|nr:uncharacterized protein M6B38_396885 [Iris pallida]
MNFLVQGVASTILGCKQFSYKPYQRPLILSSWLNGRSCLNWRFRASGRHNSRGYSRVLSLIFLALECLSSFLWPVGRSGSNAAEEDDIGNNKERTRTDQ